MTDSSSFSSLLALVDSHLSRTSIQDPEEGTSQSLTGHIQIPRLTGPSGVQSDTRLPFPGQSLGIPTFQFGRSPIDGILAEQVSNMLKAKEQKRLQEEEQLRIIEETRRLKLEEDNYVIDLMQALLTPCKQPEPKKEPLSNASSLESIFDSNFIENKEEPPMKTPEPVLPITTDMSYMLRQKVRRGKGSQFGKVLTSRLKPVAMPYLREMIDSNIVRFDFDTPSPCDVIKEKLRKPSHYNAYNFNIFDMI